MQAWQNFLSSLRRNFGDEAVERWLSPLEIIRFDACNLYLKAQDAFQLDWFEEHIRPRLKKGFLNNNNHPIKIHLSLDKEEVSAEALASSSARPKVPHAPVFIADPLDPEASLKTFLY